MQTFPMLYRKTNTGAIQQWSVYASEMVPEPNGINAPHSAVVTVYGQVGGKLQTTFDIVTEGKNTGKKNETNHYTQAVAEAKGKWVKQKKKGYIEDKEAAEAGKYDESVIEGGYLPMLAQKYKDHGHKIKSPAYLQRKLNGCRGAAIINDGKVSLWTRSRKRITSMPHIVADLEKRFANKPGEFKPDGEFYNHEWSEKYGKEKAFDMFEHFVTSKEPQDHRNDPDHEYYGLWYGDIQYHVYDIYNDQPFSQRTMTIADLLAGDDDNFDWESPVVLVETLCVEVENIQDYFDMWRKDKYEGAMVRNGDSLYESGKRSYNLQKVKAFEDAEFLIVGIEEGSGNDRGTVGAFVCEYQGKTFTARPTHEIGKKDFRKACFEDKTLWMGKMLNVQFAGYTARNNVPLQPRGIRFRESVDA